MEKDCPFCNPAIQDAIFGESQYFYAIYNIAPILPGHSMIIPRKHYSSIFDMPEELLHHLISFATEVTAFLESYYKSTGFDWSVQQGIHAGQSVSHVHWHIIPRTKNDLASPGAWYKELQKTQIKDMDSPKRKRLTPEQMRQICILLRGAFTAFK